MKRNSTIFSNKKLVIANWKMNPGTMTEAKRMLSDIKKGLKGSRGVEVVIAPPFPFIYPLEKLASRSKIKFAAQDVFWEPKGSFTGEVSPKQVKEAGASYVIVGHSERRKMGETNQIISKKIMNASKEGLGVILCVGEDKRDPGGKYLSGLQSEIKESLSGISGGRLSTVIIAYEPRWAIGKSAAEAINADELHAMSIFIRKVLISNYGKGAGASVPIIYGGSAEPSNAKELSFDGINGFLVGHASLIPAQFLNIVSAVKS